MKKEDSVLSPLGAIARLLTLVLFAYWGLYAIVAPITNVDSQMYNLARIVLAERAGLFDNPLWTSVYQVIWPWSFDAIHHPFLQLGFGYALPSFSCMAGICWVAFRMINARFGRDAAWVAQLGLLSLACLVYQATSTKNDIPLVFAVAVWVYARWRWRMEAKGWHLCWMVAAVGFMAGAKTTGVCYGLILSLWMLYELRSKRIRAVQVVGGLIVAGIFLGSIETYVESTRQFGHPLGSASLVRELSNRDGVRGGIANYSRYIVGSVYVGPSSWLPSSRLISKMADATRACLAKVGLVEAGIAGVYPHTTLIFPQSGFEEFSGFGPIGTLAMGITLFACFCWRPQEIWWHLAIAAALALGVASYTIGWAEWNNRYLIGQYALGAVACVCALWKKETLWYRLSRWVFVSVAAASAVAAPLLSFNRTPSSIRASVLDRDHFKNSNLPIIGVICERLHALLAETPDSRIYIVVWPDSVVLPYLQDNGLNANLVAAEKFIDLVNSRRLLENDIVVATFQGALPILVKVDTVVAPNVMNQVANGSAAKNTQDIFRVTYNTVPKTVGPE